MNQNHQKDNKYMYNKVTGIVVLVMKAIGRGGLHPR
jgi:hypothetical protein